MMRRGASAKADPALVASDQAPAGLAPAGLAPTGFDPLRDDLCWLRREIQHCRRMEYVTEARRFERIAAALETILVGGAA
jgi:hypothetical protein